MDSEAVANGWGPKAFCPSDEHYIPTLLASKGLDNETDCTVRALLPCIIPLSCLGQTRKAHSTTYILLPRFPKTQNFMRGKRISAKMHHGPAASVPEALE